MEYLFYSKDVISTDDKMDSTVESFTLVEAKVDESTNLGEA